MSLGWYLVPGLIPFAELNSEVRFSYFQPEVPFLGKFGLKNQNCQFKLRFGIYNQSQNILRTCQSQLIFLKHLKEYNIYLA